MEQSTGLPLSIFRRLRLMKMTLTFWHCVTYLKSILQRPQPDLANLVAGKIGDNPINTDRRIARMVSSRSRVDLGFALEVCDHIGLTVSVERKT